MEKHAKIYIAGHRGMVGSAIMRQLKHLGYHNLCHKTHADLDLIRQTQVEDFFLQEKPDYVFLAAARVGGILANSVYPAQFIYENIQIQTNVIHAAFITGVKKLLFLGSSCIYPRNCPQPMKEEYLLTGPLEPTNEAYAIAKISGIKLCQFYHSQYKSNFLSVMPTNLYGPGDNFDLENSHVLPGLIRKFYEAQITHQPSVTLWGTGSAYREFLHVDDMAAACVHVMTHMDAKDISKQGISHINVGTGKDISIKELAELIRQLVQFSGHIEYDVSKPEGMPKKLLDITRITQMGWAPRISLKNGIETTVRWFEQHHSELSCP
jgi:GDP-L-fucose synthase